MTNGRSNWPGVKVERIYRVLLNLPLTEMSKYRLSKEADVDRHWVIQNLRDLEKLEIMSGTSLLRPKDLFYLWAARKNTSQYREYHIQEPLNMVKGAKFEMAMTTYFAEQLVGDYLFPRYMDLYVRGDDAGKWHEFLVHRGYVGKGNVRIILADEHVFWNVNKKYLVDMVCIQQLIVDLLREGGVCIEAAENLMERFYG